jgi:hypothetical protein
VWVNVYFPLKNYSYTAFNSTYKNIFVYKYSGNEQSKTIK